MPCMQSLGSFNLVSDLYSPWGKSFAGFALLVCSTKVLVFMWQRYHEHLIGGWDKQEILAFHQE